jgi:hypothetical protein
MDPFHGHPDAAAKRSHEFNSYSPPAVKEIFVPNGANYMVKGKAKLVSKEVGENGCRNFTSGSGDMVTEPGTGRKIISGIFFSQCNHGIIDRIYGMYFRFVFPHSYVSNCRYSCWRRVAFSFVGTRCKTRSVQMEKG